MSTRDERDERDEIAFCRDVDDSECEVSEAALEQPFPLGALLRDDAALELSRREGEWDAFQAQVLHRIGAAEVAEERMSLEDRAVALFKASVEAEVADLAPQFGRQFREGIEARIWQAAKVRPSLFERISAFFSGSFRRERWLPLGFAVAAGIAALAVFGPFDLSGTDGESYSSNDEGRVSVDDMSFEGSATVMSEGAVTVVWLTDPTS